MTMDPGVPHKNLLDMLLIWLFTLINGAIVYYVIKLRRKKLLQ